jgi:hypothetical protein
LAGRKRKVRESFPPISRSEFAEYLEAARQTKYLRRPELAMRDASLLAFEFLFKTRVSEGVGRVYPETRRERRKASFVDRYEGIHVADFRVAKARGVKVLRCRFRVLKRGRRRKTCPACGERNSLDSSYCRYCGNNMEHAKFDYKLKEVWEWDSVRLDDPFVEYILEWLEYLKAKQFRGKVWNITRQRAWQIMNKLGIMNHTQRHWRATQLADTHDPFELKEALHRATIPFEYVHRSERRRLEKEKEADQVWK